MTTHSDEPAWVDDVLHFWFHELSEAQWFAVSDPVDEKIRERFLALHEQLAAQGGAGAHSPAAMLATVIVLDQFSRNLFRGDARAFAADALARGVSRSAIAASFEQTMTPQERLFLYLPFEHSEDAADQRLGVELVRALGNQDWISYAEAHKAVIDRFDRFPHRNAALGRVSTPAEIALLREPGKPSWAATKRPPL